MKWKLDDDPRKVPERSSWPFGRWVYLVKGDGYWAVGVTVDARMEFKRWRHCRDHGTYWATSDHWFEILGEYSGRLEAKAEARRRRRACRWALDGKELQPRVMDIRNFELPFRTKNVKS